MSAFDARGRGSPVYKNLFDHPPISGVVFHNQHGNASESMMARRGFLAGFGRPGESRRKVKSASLADFAVHPNPSSHKRDKLRRNGETQPRPPVLPCRRSIRLREGLEDQMLLVLWNSDSRVSHGEVKRDLLLRNFPDFHRDENLAVARKLDAVSGEVDEDLPESSRVARQGLGHIRSEAAYEFHSLFMSAHRERFHGVLDATAQIHLDTFQVEFPRFNAGKIENIVDHPEQCIA